MSKSIHQTIKSVFGGKSAAEIQRMIEVEDPDLLALMRKKGIKREVRNARALSTFLEQLDVMAPEQSNDE